MTRLASRLVVWHQWRAARHTAAVNRHRRYVRAHQRMARRWADDDFVAAESVEHLMIARRVTDVIAIGAVLSGLIFGVAALHARAWAIAALMIAWAALGAVAMVLRPDDSERLP